MLGSRPVPDLLLLHAPSVYDFRERDDLLFAKAPEASYYDQVLVAID